MGAHEHQGNNTGGARALRLSDLGATTPVHGPRRPCTRDQKLTKPLKRAFFTALARFLQKTLNVDNFTYNSALSEFAREIQKLTISFFLTGSLPTGIEFWNGGSRKTFRRRHRRSLVANVVQQNREKSLRGIVRTVNPVWDTPGYEEVIGKLSRVFDVFGGFGVERDWRG